MSTIQLEAQLDDNVFPSNDAATTTPPPIVEDGPAAHVDQLLKQPGVVLHALETGDGMAARTRTYVQVLVAGTATFGASLGFFRGGAQIAYAAVKLPLVVLIMLAVVAPLLYALERALERPASMARDVALLVSALARGALVLAAETPLIWATHAIGSDYHRMILATVVACSIAGGASFWFLWGVISATQRSRWSVAVS